MSLEELEDQLDALYIELSELEEDRRLLITDIDNIESAIHSMKMGQGDE